MRQYRSDVATGRVQVTLDNTGTLVLGVEQVRLDSPAFAAVPPTTKDTRLAPGRRVDLPVPHGEPRCDPPPGPGEHRAVAVLVTPDGRRHDVSLPLTGGDALLDRLRRRQCTAGAVRRAVTVELSPDWERLPEREPTAQGRLRLRRGASDDRVVLHGLGGTVIFTVRPSPAPGEPLLTLEPGETERSLPVEVRAARCDAHALIESKRTFEFPAQVEVAGQGPQTVVVRPDGDGRRLLDRLIADSCGPGSG